MGPMKAFLDVVWPAGLVLILLVGAWVYERVRREKYLFLAHLRVIERSVGYTEVGQRAAQGMGIRSRVDLLAHYTAELVPILEEGRKAMGAKAGSVTSLVPPSLKEKNASPRYERNDVV